MNTILRSHDREITFAEAKVGDIVQYSDIEYIVTDHPTAYDPSVVLCIYWDSQAKRWMTATFGARTACRWKGKLVCAD